VEVEEENIIIHEEVNIDVFDFDEEDDEDDNGNEE